MILESEGRGVGGEVSVNRKKMERMRKISCIRVHVTF